MSCRETASADTISVIEGDYVAGATGRDSSSHRFALERRVDVTFTADSAIDDSSTRLGRAWMRLGCAWMRLGCAWDAPATASSAPPAAAVATDVAALIWRATLQAATDWPNATPSR